MRMWRNFIIAVMVFISLSISAHATSIVTYMEVVLSDAGTLIEGQQDVTISLLDGEGSVLWTETHEDLIVYNGVVAFEFGTINNLETYYFFGSDVRLTLTINNDSIDLPMYAIPFSFFAHAANLVNSIQMNGVFHSDLVNERIGISIDHPTPSVKFEIGGAMRLSSANTIETGVIRWNSDTMRLEGRHNSDWQLLDVSDSDKFDSKWSESNSTEGFYVFDQRVFIGGFGYTDDFFVSGSVYASGGVDLDSDFIVTGQAIINNEFGVTLNSDVIVKDIYINAANYFNFTNGLAMSGTFYGDGSGLTDIDRDSLLANSIQNNEINPLVFGSNAFTDDSISNENFTLEIIDLSLLNDEFILDNSFLMPLIISDNMIVRETITIDDLADDFDLTTYVFVEGSVVSVNIAAQSIDDTKINQNELIVADFVEEFIDTFSLIIEANIQSHHIQNGAVEFQDIQSGVLTFDHLSFDANFAIGGTNQTTYGDVGDLIVVSNNQFVSEDNIVVSNSKFGINNDDPLYYLDILKHNNVDYPLKIFSETNSDTSIVLRNDLGHWDLKLTDSGSFIIENNLHSIDNIFEISSNGFIGVDTDPSTEKLTLSGAVHLGDSVVDDASLSPGTIYFSDADNKFKFITDGGVQTLAFQELTEPIPSYLATSKIENHSDQSFVSLGDSAIIAGSDHIIQGGFHSYIDGYQLITNQLSNVQMVGKMSVANVANDSQIFGDELIANQVSSTIIIGDKGSFDQVDQSVILGDSHRVMMSNDLTVTGRANDLDFVRSSLINGHNIDGTYIDASDISGHSHLIGFVRDAYVDGQYHSLEHVQDITLTGNHNVGFQLYDALVDGQYNFINNSHGSVIRGDMNHITMGDGHYFGTGNRHVGSGRPVLRGDNISLVGSQHTIVDGSDTVVIGATDMADQINLDDSIVLAAHGGVDIVHNDITIAHLGEGAGSWSLLSDQGLKVNVRPIDTIAILDKMSGLSVSEWRYKGQDYVQHIGPMAQDFYQLFKLGNDDRFINSVDIDGIIFASIQGLGQRLNLVQEQKRQLSKTSSDLSKLISEYELKEKEWSVSANVLSAQESKIQDRYKKIHKKEIKQRRLIEELNDRIVRIKELVESDQ